MKIDDIVKQLANRINQPHVIEIYLKKVAKESYGKGFTDVVKSLPNDEEVKAHIDTLPYYGACTTEYNEGFEDGVKWLKEQLKQ